MGQIMETAVPTLPTAESWDLPNRQRIARSRTAELLANDADRDELIASVTDELREALPAAVQGVKCELICARDHEMYEDALLAELGSYTRLTTGGWGATEREEWLQAATDELMDFPLSMLIPELALQRRREPWPNKLVPAIVANLEPRMAKLKAERDTLVELLEIASE